MQKGVEEGIPGAGSGVGGYKSDNIVGVRAERLAGARELLKHAKVKSSKVSNLWAEARGAELSPYCFGSWPASWRIV